MKPKTYQITARNSAGETYYAVRLGMCPNAQSIGLTWERKVHAAAAMVRLMREWRGLNAWRVVAVDPRLLDGGLRVVKRA